jgi:hypothetical protein
VYWDARCLIKGERWEDGFIHGLLHSLCFLPILSYGSTAPLAAFPPSEDAALTARGWDAQPMGRVRLRGDATDEEDNLLKEWLITATLIERRAAASAASASSAADGRSAVAQDRGVLQTVFPVMVGRPHPAGHGEYPRVGSYFHVQGGGGLFPQGPSPATARAAGYWLREAAGIPEAEARHAAERSVASVMQGLTALQGCALPVPPFDVFSDASDRRFLSRALPDTEAVKRRLFVAYL